MHRIRSPCASCIHHLPLQQCFQWPQISVHLHDSFNFLTSCHRPAKNLTGWTDAPAWRDAWKSLAEYPYQEYRYDTRVNFHTNTNTGMEFHRYQYQKILINSYWYQMFTDNNLIYSGTLPWYWIKLIRIPLLLRVYTDTRRCRYWCQRYWYWSNTSVH